MENVRIAILDSRDAVMAAMDNLLPDALHYCDDELHEYLKGSASTYRFTASAKHPDSLYIVEGAKIAFVYRGKDYYFNIMQVERNEFEVTAECYFTSFELLNEYVPVYSSNGPKSFEEYLIAFDPERTVTLGINEVSDKRISNEWTGEDTVLARLFSVASLFDAEIEFEAKLNDDYSLGQIVMNVYQEHSDTNQGMGLRRNDICLRYGKNVTGVKKTSDVLQLYTGIRPYGKDGLTIEGIDRKEYDDAGRVEFETSGTNIYAPLARDRFPSNLWNANDGYIFMVKNYDTDNKEKLYSMALSALKENCVPKVQYDIEGYFDSGIGDTFDVTDEEYNPTLYLQARVTEQIRSFTDPKTNKTVFSNFKELQPEIDPELIKRMNALIEANKVYVCNLFTDNGVVFKNNTGETTLQPSVMDGSKDVTQNFRYRWTKDGAFLKESATLKVTAEEVDGKAVYKYEAIDSYDNVKGFYEVTIADVEDGKPGESGKSFYTWIKFADDEHGIGMSDLPDGKQYLGIAYNKETPEKSENPKDYAWARITGEGIPGVPGEDGKTYYTWVRYADNEYGSGMSDAPDGKAYIGFAFNKEMPTESNNPADYKWSKIKGETGPQGPPGLDGLQGEKGEQGIPGRDGVDGKTQYTHIAYANSSDGYTDFSLSDSNREYIGMYADFLQNDSTYPNRYAWSKIKGADGANGTPGKPGTDGRTPYLHIAYANSADGSVGFSTTDSVGKSYIGQYTDFTERDSENYRVYAWTKIKGEDGADGKPGIPGEPGTPGKDGKGIESITEYYLTSASDSGITTSSYGWSTAIPTMTPERKYLWNYEEIRYNDGTSEKKTPKIIGVYGDEGIGIRNIVNYYLATSLGSGVTTSTYGWTTTKQDMTETKRYLWNYEVITYTDGTRYESPLTIIGAYGQTGEPGKNNLIVSPTAPENPVVGQLWQTASGDAIKRWDGKQWVMHYLSVDNLKADVLSAITANLGEVIAGLLRDKTGLFKIDLDNSVISSQKNGKGVELTEGELRFTEQIDQLQVLATYTASKIMYRLADASGDLFSMQYTAGEKDMLVHSDNYGDYYLGETLKSASEKPVILARTTSSSFQTFTIEDFTHFRYFILICGARMNTTLYRPLAECTIHPEVFLHCNTSNGGAVACYAEEPSNYRAEFQANSATSIRLKCRGMYDMAILLGVR